MVTSVLSVRQPHEAAPLKELTAKYCRGSGNTADCHHRCMLDGGNTDAVATSHVIGFCTVPYHQ